MAVIKTTEFEIDHKFDAKTCRHYLNGICSVLHCHHYATLYTQLADDAKDFSGERLLKEAAEDTFYESLRSYYEQKGIEDLADRITVAEQYWQAVGMGLIRFQGVGKYELVAEMEYSHVDEGWLKKWGSRSEPVNFMTSGFVAAVACLLSGRPPRSFGVKETSSLVSGDAVSTFKAVSK